MEADQPEQIRLFFFKKGGLKETGAEMERFRQRVNRDAAVMYSTSKIKSFF